MIRTSIKTVMAASAVALLAACAQPAAEPVTTVTIDQLNAGVSSAEAAANRAQGSADRAEAAAARSEAAAQRAESIFQRTMRK